MGTNLPRINKLQRILETKKNQMDNTALIPAKTNSTFSMRNGGGNTFLVKNMSIEADDDVGFDVKNTVFKNSTESTIRQSSVVTKTVIRKKKVLLNGELLEEEEEESSEVQPNSREIVNKSNTIFANQDIKQGTTLSNKQFLAASKTGSFTTKFPQNFSFPADFSTKFSNFDNDPLLDFSHSNLVDGMKMDSVNFRSSNVRTTQRMMAFQGSINGEEMSPVIVQEERMYTDKPLREIEGGSKRELPALQGPEDFEKSRKKTVLEKLGFRKKSDDRTLKDNVKIGKIIDELITTEKKYIADLHRLVEDYMSELQRTDAPKELAEDKYCLFGNVEHIYMFHDVQFLTDLNDSEKLPSAIANCFLKNSKEFVLYRHYNRNKPRSELSLLKYEAFFDDKQKELDDIQSLASYLIKPTQRLARYILLLQEIGKECKKNKVAAKEVNEAVQMLQTEIKFGNDLMALDALRNLPQELDIKAQGDLLFRDKFKVVPPEKKKKYEAMIFLFKEMIIISDVQLEDNTDAHYYKDHIPLSEVGLTECHNDKNIFKIWYLNHNKKNYTLETKPDVKKNWVEGIKENLERELQKLKEESKRKSGGLDQSKFIDLTKNKFVKLASDKNVKRQK